MNDLVVQNNKSPEREEVPSRPSEEVIRGGGDEVATLVRSIRELFGTGSNVPDMNRGEELLAKYKTMAGDLGRLAGDLKVLLRPALNGEIADGLKLVVESRANHGTGDRKIYGRMLLEDVAAQQPSIGALVATCRKVRRVCKYRPEIAEVIEILADEEYKLKFELDSARTTLAREGERLAVGIEREKETISKRPSV